jgi:hypothetical protein
MLRSMMVAAALLLVLSCASAGDPDVAVITAGADARTFPGLMEIGTGFFGGTKSVGNGRLQAGAGGVVWQNERDSERNASLRPDVISRIWLTCASRPGENLCLDLGITTLTGKEYHFRDQNWEGGANTSILAAYEHMRTLYPQVRFDRRSVDDFR